MIHIIAIMLSGMALGYFFRNAGFSRHTERTISLTIITMLFILGFSVGSNEEIVANLFVYGGQAAVLAISGMAGSVLASWAVYNFLFRKGGER